MNTKEDVMKAITVGGKLFNSISGDNKTGLKPNEKPVRATAPIKKIIEAGRDLWDTQIKDAIPDIKFEYFFPNDQRYWQGSIHPWIHEGCPYEQEVQWIIDGDGDLTDFLRRYDYDLSQNILDSDRPLDTITQDEMTSRFALVLTIFGRLARYIVSNNAAAGSSDRQSNQSRAKKMHDFFVAFCKHINSKELLHDNKTAKAMHAYLAGPHAVLLNQIAIIINSKSDLHLLTSTINDLKDFFNKVEEQALARLITYFQLVSKFDPSTGLFGSDQNLNKSTNLINAGMLQVVSVNTLKLILRRGGVNKTEVDPLKTVKEILEKYQYILLTTIESFKLKRDVVNELLECIKEIQALHSLAGELAEFTSGLGWFWALRGYVDLTQLELKIIATYRRTQLAFTSCTVAACVEKNPSANNILNTNSIVNADCYQQSLTNLIKALRELHNHDRLNKMSNNIVQKLKNIRNIGSSLGIDNLVTEQSISDAEKMLNPVHHEEKQKNRDNTQQTTPMNPSNSARQQMKKKEEKKKKARVQRQQQQQNKANTTQNFIQEPVAPSETSSAIRGSSSVEEKRLDGVVIPSNIKYESVPTYVRKKLNKHEEDDEVDDNSFVPSTSLPVPTITLSTPLLMSSSPVIFSFSNGSTQTTNTSQTQSSPKHKGNLSINTYKAKINSDNQSVDSLTTPPPYTPQTPATPATVTRYKYPFLAPLDDKTKKYFNKNDKDQFSKYKRQEEKFQKCVIHDEKGIPTILVDEKNSEANQKLVKTQQAYIERNDEILVIKKIYLEKKPGSAWRKKTKDKKNYMAQAYVTILITQYSQAGTMAQVLLNDESILRLTNDDFKIVSNFITETLIPQMRNSQKEHDDYQLSSSGSSSSCCSQEPDDDESDEHQNELWTPSIRDIENLLSQKTKQRNTVTIQINEAKLTALSPTGNTTGGNDQTTTTSRTPNQSVILSQLTDSTTPAPLPNEIKMETKTISPLQKEALSIALALRDIQYIYYDLTDQKSPLSKEEKERILKEHGLDIAKNGQLVLASSYKLAIYKTPIHRDQNPITGFAYIGKRDGIRQLLKTNGDNYATHTAQHAFSSSTETPATKCSKLVGSFIQHFPVPQDMKKLQEISRLSTNSIKIKQLIIMLAKNELSVDDAIFGSLADKLFLSATSLSFLTNANNPDMSALQNTLGVKFDKKETKLFNNIVIAELVALYIATAKFLYHLQLNMPYSVIELNNIYIPIATRAFDVYPGEGYINLLITLADTLLTSCPLAMEARNTLNDTLAKRQESMRKLDTPFLR